MEIVAARETQSRWGNIKQELGQPCANGEVHEYLFYFPEELYANDARFLREVVVAREANRGGEIDEDGSLVRTANFMSALYYYYEEFLSSDTHFFALECVCLRCNDA